MSARQILGEEAMLAFGAEFVRGLRAGDVVFLTGDLGAGKTTLVRGMGLGLGFGRVKSPSYALMAVYETEPRLVHLDLYRVRGEAGALEGLGLEVYLDESVTVVEWPEESEGFWTGRRVWRIAIEGVGEGRTVVVTAPADESVELG